MKITSTQSKILKQIISLQDNRMRKRGDEFGVEGFREINLALTNGFKVSKVLVCPELLTEEETIFLREKNFNSGILWELSLTCFDKLLVRKRSSGLYFVFYKKEEGVLLNPIGSESLYLVLDGIEKPANLGAILRSCDGAGVTQVILTNPKVDIYHPHVVRGSLGACFSLSCFDSTSQELYDFFVQHKIRILTSYLDKSSEIYFKKNLKFSLALVLGSEDTGVSSFWVKNQTDKIIIPMKGQVDSLNVSVAAAVLLFEVRRQRFESRN